MNRMLATTLAAVSLVAGFPLSSFGQENAASGLAQLEAMQEAFRASIDRVRPSVVSIFLWDSRIPMGDMGLNGPQPLPQNIPGRSGDHQPASFGSGVILRPEGLVATCFHVVRSASRPGAALDILVQLHDGQILSAVIYAADPRSDLAVLKLQSPAPLKLNAIAIGDGGKLFPGQFVLALGNPFGVAAPDGAVSASWGIISSIRRRPAEPAFGEPRYSIVVQGRTLVQTDARLNMGSSGAALINLKGEMVGIGMALSAAIGFEAPGGFAQPTDDLTRRVLDTLAEGREVEYGFIGISFQPTVAMGGPGSLAPPRGVVVRSIELPSTQQAGLTPGDIVTEVNGRTIRDLHDLILVVGSLPVGTKLRTKVLRGESEKDLVLTLAKYPPRDEPIVTNKRPAWNGIRVDHLSTRIDASGFQFGDDQRLPMEGVVVREVLAGSPAYEKGVQVRQIVTQVNGKTVADPDQFDKMVAEESGPVRLTFEGGSEQVFGAGDEKKSNR